MQKTLAMEEDHDGLRTRRACDNCRRKKTRCSGERPTCRFCAHLQQHCTYTRRISGIRGPDPEHKSGITRGAGYSSSRKHNLASRLALVESKLGLDGDDHAASRPPRDILAPLVKDSRYQFESHSIPKNSNYASVESSKFSTLPPIAVMEHLTDVYFTSCHNQPYSFFVETQFRHQLAEGRFSNYLLLAFIATSARFSAHAYFENRQMEAIQMLSRTAWHVVLEHAFTSQRTLNLQIVQATSLLAVIDFTAGEHRMGWVKVGLALHIAQSLRLSSEPENSLSLWQQEEQRRVFWSLYVLDRFVSCSRFRPPSIVDVDCTMKLPASERDLAVGLPSASPSLAVMKDLPNTSTCRSLNNSALLVLAASILGRTVRYTLQQRTTTSCPPWNFRSDFAEISTMLLNLESLLSVRDENLATYINENFTTDKGFDKPRVGQFVWSRAVYHLSCCLLHHPFFLYRHIKLHKDSFPHSFIRSSVRQCMENAEQLTNILEVVYRTGCCARGSFLGYLAIVAGSIHKLYACTLDVNEQTRHHLLAQICQDYLEKEPVYWRSYPHMATALAQFRMDQTQGLALIENPSVLHELVETDLDQLTCILDYGWSSDTSRTDKQVHSIALQDSDISDWNIFNDLFGNQGLSLDFFCLGNMNSSFPGSGQEGYVNQTSRP